MHYGTENQIEAKGTERLAVEGAVTYFAALVEKDGELKLVRGFSFVKAGLTPPAQRQAGIPLIMNMVRSIRPNSRKALAKSLGSMTNTT